MLKNLAYFGAGALTMTLTSYIMLYINLKKDPDFIQGADQFYKKLV